MEKRLTGATGGRDALKMLFFLVHMTGPEASLPLNQQKVVVGVHGSRCMSDTHIIYSGIQANRGAFLVTSDRPLAKPGTTLVTSATAIKLFSEA